MRPIEAQCAKIMDAIRERERLAAEAAETAEAERDGGGFALEPENVPASALSAERDHALQTLHSWRANAQIHGRAAAEAECDRIIKFIKSVCP